VMQYIQRCESEGLACETTYCPSPSSSPSPCKQALNRHKGWASAQDGKTESGQ
jgi:hypothetical protein